MNDSQTLLDRMAEAIRADHPDGPPKPFQVIGIRTGGVWVAEALAARLGHTAPIGSLDIAFYRDDFSRIGLHPEVRPSHIPFPVEDAHILLVDDVLHTGRTVRAALNEIFDYGRPASIRLAVLIDRGGRELPICAQYSGERLELPEYEEVLVSGPEPLTWQIVQREVRA
ncbi:MAG: bifunctional pyr operon transcriptional regulator/uracil phosphoribosyltransferase PyrR [Gammaproteobacteria bacterium]|nr:MAG: bifunctional pyr operon transcriptional regulator/uracil phosphoribosyltransferase PyrR [Gammaproteobacteria bacterium]